jgi:hypothetical protein
MRILDAAAFAYLFALEMLGSGMFCACKYTFVICNRDRGASSTVHTLQHSWFTCTNACVQAYAYQFGQIFLSFEYHVVMLWYGFVSMICQWKCTCTLVRSNICAETFKN